MDLIVDEIIERLYPGAEIIDRQFDDINGTLLNYQCRVKYKDHYGITITVPPNLNGHKNNWTNDEKLERIEIIIRQQMAEAQLQWLDLKAKHKEMCEMLEQKEVEKAVNS